MGSCSWSSATPYARPVFRVISSTNTPPAAMGGQCLRAAAGPREESRAGQVKVAPVLSIHRHPSRLGGQADGVEHQPGGLQRRVWGLNHGFWAPPWQRVWHPLEFTK